MRSHRSSPHPYPRGKWIFIPASEVTGHTRTVVTGPARACSHERIDTANMGTFWLEATTDGVGLVL